MTRARPKSSLPPQKQPAGGHRDFGVYRLNIEAPSGAYAIDKIAPTIPIAPQLSQASIRSEFLRKLRENSFAAEPFQVGIHPERNVRRAVNEIGYRAHAQETALLGSIERAASARDHLAYLETLASGGLRILPPGKIEAVHFMVEPKVSISARHDERPDRTLQSSSDEVFRQIEEINRQSAELKATIRAFLTAHEPVSAYNTGNASALEAAFVDIAVIWWETMTGQPPGRSRGGPFAEFLGAAWSDLQFPLLEDAVASLGRLYERRKKQPRSSP